MKPKTAPTKPLPKRKPRTSVVSFRLRDEEAQALQKRLELSPVVGIKTPCQLARKIVLDFSTDRMAYADPLDMLGSCELSAPYPEVTVKSCFMPDKAWLKALSAYLTTDENCTKLRRFMLQSGWPTSLKKAYAKAKTGPARVLVMQKAIAKMAQNI